VDSSNLKPAQLERLQAALRRQLAYLNKLCGRIQKLPWPIDDPLGRAMMRARDAVQELYTATMGTGSNPKR
jgi:hypothetical protein